MPPVTFLESIKTIVTGQESVQTTGQEKVQTSRLHYSKPPYTQGQNDRKTERFKSASRHLWNPLKKLYSWSGKRSKK